MLVLTRRQGEKIMERIIKERLFVLVIASMIFILSLTKSVKGQEFVFPTDETMSTAEIEMKLFDLRMNYLSPNIKIIFPYFKGIASSEYGNTKMHINASVSKMDYPLDERRKNIKDFCNYIFEEAKSTFWLRCRSDLSGDGYAYEADSLKPYNVDINVHSEDFGNVIAKYRNGIITYTDAFFQAEKK